MSNRAHGLSPAEMAPAYDPFGERVDAPCVPASNAGDRQARSVAVIGFWAVAAALTAGRIYFGDETAAHLIASAHAQVAALMTAIL